MIIIPLSKCSVKRQVSRAGSNEHILGVVADEPVLSLRAPVHDITSSDISREGDSLVRLDAKSLKASEHLNSIVGATKRDVKLGDFVTSDLSSVRDLGSDAVEHVPESWVTTRGTRGGKTSLRSRASGVLRHEVDVAVGVRTGGCAEVGRVDPGVEVERHAGEVGGKDVVGGVHADVSVGLSCGSHAAGGNIATGVELGDLEVAVAEVGVGKTETELVDGLNLLLIEGSVVNEDALLEILLRDGGVGGVQNISAVVRALGGHGEGKLSTRVDATVENVGNRVARLLARNTSPQDGGNVGVISVLLNQNSADRVNDQDGVIAGSRNVSDHFISALPESKVVAVTKVVIDCNVALAAITVNKDDSNLGLLGQREDLIEVRVVAKRLVDATILVDNFILDGRVGSDQVREVGGSRTPGHAESTLVATTVRTSVGAIRISKGIFANNSGKLLLASQRKSVVGVLQQDGRSRAEVSDELAVAITDIDVLVDQTIALTNGVVSVAVGVEAVRIEVDGDVCLFTSNVVIRRENANASIVQSPLRHGSVDNSNGHVGAEESTAGVIKFLNRVSWHAHIQTSKNGRDTGVSAVPIRNNEALEAELILQEMIQDVAVLARL